MSTILRPLLGLLHLIYNIYLVIKIQWAYLQRELIGLLKPRSLKLPENILDECDTSRIKRMPRHLVVVIGNEDISYIDLARIISWCVALGIQYVSFYDQHGIMKENSSTFRRKFEKSAPNIVSRVIWNEKSSFKSMVNGTNGFKNTTKIRFLSYEDGKPEIVSLAKEFCEAVKLGLIKTDEIDSSLLDEKLRVDHFPDPELAIVTGTIFSTFGLLPWQTRTTEFFNLSSHHKLSPKDFIGILEIYGKCEQRYGK